MKEELRQLYCTAHAAICVFGVSYLSAEYGEFLVPFSIAISGMLWGYFIGRLSR